jgi:hypothetical protein
MGRSSWLSAGRYGVVLLQVIVVLSCCCCCCMGVRGDKNVAFSPCDDTTVEKGDGFTFGLLIGSNASFFSQSRNYVQQLSPCNVVNSHSSSSLYSNRLSVFRPKVDEISLLVVNYTELNPENFSGGGFAVVYAGSKFAAVSSPKFVANSSYHITSLSMVLLLFNLQLGCHFLPDFFWAALCEAETRFWCLDQLVFAPCLGLALLMNLSSPKTSGVRVEDSCGELLSNVTWKKCILSLWMMSRT